MKNPTIKELVEKMTKGEISKTEFDLFLKVLIEENDSIELDQALRDFFESLASAEQKVKMNQKPEE